MNVSSRNANNAKRIAHANNEPSKYPWPKPPYSCVVTGYTTHSQNPSPTVPEPSPCRASESGVITGLTVEYLELTQVPGRRLSSARIHTSSCENDTFNAYALDHKQLRAEERIPVLAVGSNANVSVMVNKLRIFDPTISVFFPHLKCRVHNLSVGYFAQVTERGYIAATPFHNPGAKSDLWISFLTRQQFIAINRTEPGYTCRLVSSHDYPLEILTRDARNTSIVSEIPDVYYIYEANCGYIVPSQTEPTNSTKTAKLYLKDQKTIFTFLTNNGFTFEKKTTKERCSELANSPQKRLALVEFLQTQSMVHSPDIKSSDQNICSESGEEHSEDNPITYADIHSLPRDKFFTTDSSPQLLTTRNKADSARNRNLFLVVSSGDDIARDGEQCIRLNSQYRTFFGTHVSIEIANSPSLQARPAAATVKPFVAAVRYSDSTPKDIIEVDQVIRDGLGISINEWVGITRAQVPKNVVADLLFPRQYQMVRAQASDTTNMETQVAFLSPITMAILGLNNGDEIVVEGTPHPQTGVTPNLHMRAISYDLTNSDRIKLGLCDDGLFSGGRTVLGVNPDIQGILIDRRARTLLNLGESVITPVRIRVCRAFTVKQELRELMLLLIVAFIGLITVLPKNAMLPMSLLIFAAALFIVIMRIRSAISPIKSRLKKIRS